MTQKNIRNGSEQSLGSLRLILEEVNTRFEFLYEAKSNIEDRTSTILGFVGILVGIYVSFLGLLFGGYIFDRASLMTPSCILPSISLLAFSLSFAFILAAVRNGLRATRTDALLVGGRLPDYYEAYANRKEQENLTELIEGRIVDIEANNTTYITKAFNFEQTIAKMQVSLWLFVVASVGLAMVSFDLTPGGPEVLLVVPIVGLLAYFLVWRMKETDRFRRLLERSKKEYAELCARYGYEKIKHFELIRI